MAATPPPDDIEALKALLALRDGELAHLRGAVMTLELALSVRTLEIEQLKLQIAKLKRMQFGRKSEKIDRKLEQLEARLEDLVAEEGAAEQKSPAPTMPRQKSVHVSLPAHLPREEHIIEPEEQSCPACGGALKLLGEDVSEQLEMIEAAFKVIRHVRRKKACACCDCIVQAPAPSRPIQRSFAGPGLLANIAVSKFADHQPLYRQAVMHARQGVELDPASTGRWMGACAELLAPLVEALRRYVLAPGKVHTDDTTIPVLSPGNGQTKIGRLWVYVRDDRNAGSKAPPAVWFAYSPNRQGLHPQSHLADFRGVLQADAYAGYNKIVAGDMVQEAGCMAHARRKVHDLHASKATPTTTEILRRIGELYAIEAQIRGQPVDERKRIRQLQARPLLDELEAWLRNRLLTLSTQSDTTKAIKYMLNQWQALIYYCGDGVAEIDNNIAENALRGCCLGRKNFLFFGADSGGERAAAMYGLIGSARLNGINPEAYLRYVFTHIADYPINRIADLLPWNVADRLTQKIA
ncbi:IS66 family transposase [Collimonas sp.]|jgi:transposase|uniref:IS66 family transposase n=1 Tax=Collimonas sp. TaxID=1963772 RepID=UPI002C0DF125|nr:IS66 family transposase [Collimonas sp.]HWW06370.1 IS66 family transposase [Collimonas sp.]